MKKPIINEVFTDNGEHSHWNLIDDETNSIIWSEDPIEDKAMGFPIHNDILSNQLNILIKNCEVVIGMLNDHNMETSDSAIAINAMMQAYTNVKQFIDVNKQ